MPTLLSLLMAVLPAVLIVYYYKQDRARPEPKGLIINVFFLRVFSALCVSFLVKLVGEVDVVFK